MSFKQAISYLALTVLALNTNSVNAVLPAVATSNTVMDSAVAMPLSPQIARTAQPINVQPIQAQSVQFQTVKPVTFGLGVANTVQPSQSQTQLQTKITASVVAANPQGGEILAPITSQTQLSKGSIIEYHGYIINNAAERVKTLKATFNIPNGTELQSIDSISPQPAYGSNDGQRFNYLPIKFNVAGVLQEVPLSYYRTLQWDIVGLGLNEVAEVKYRVVIK